MSKGDVHSTLKLMEKALDTPLLGDTALEVCRRAGFQALLRGEIAPEGAGYRLSMDEVNCANGRILATSYAEASSKDHVLNTLDSLASSARRKLGETGESIERYNVPVGEATTFSFEALQDYTKGAELGNAGKIVEAVPLFRKAVDLDPKFALAVAALGTAYAILGDREQAGLYYKQAFALSDNISEREKLHIRSNYYQMFVRDFAAARSLYEDQTRIYPADHTGWAALADMDTQVGDYPAAIAAGEHALRIAAPRQEIDYYVLARAYKCASRFAEAKRSIAAAQAQNMDAPGLHYLLLDIAMAEGDRQVIEREIAWSKQDSVPSRSLEYQAIYEADQGHFSRAESLFESAIAQAGKDVDLNFAKAMRTDEAGIELQAGRVAQAKNFLHQIRPDSEGKERFNSANFAVFAARAGEFAVTEEYLALPMMYPHETVALTLYRPEMNALLALGRKDAGAAIAALEVSRPYELAHSEVIEIRGDAYLALADGEHAQAEFQKLIGNPAVEAPTLPRTLIAHVGLARAYALQHKTEDARAEYQKFFSLWPDADPDIPILQQARAEYARL
jgi:tetratricopeptide (TPR) repeat protein